MRGGKVYEPVQPPARQVSLIKANVAAMGGMVRVRGSISLFCDMFQKMGKIGGQTGLPTYFGGAIENGREGLQFRVVE